MGDLFSKPPQSGRQVYCYTTLELREIVDRLNDRQVKPPVLASLLRQVPYQVNYCYDRSTKRVCSHSRSKFIVSSTPFYAHLQLKGLTHLCIMRLTEDQHNQVEALVRE
jgi:hypothetical protein